MTNKYKMNYRRPQTSICVPTE